MAPRALCLSYYQAPCKNMSRDAPRAARSIPELFGDACEAAGVLGSQSDWFVLNPACVRGSTATNKKWAQLLAKARRATLVVPKLEQPSRNWKRAAVLDHEDWSGTVATLSAAVAPVLGTSTAAAVEPLAPTLYRGASPQEIICMVRPTKERILVVTKSARVVFPICRCRPPCRSRPAR